LAPGYFAESTTRNCCFFDARFSTLNGGKYGPPHLCLRSRLDLHFSYRGSQSSCLGAKLARAD